MWSSSLALVLLASGHAAQVSASVPSLPELRAPRLRAPPAGQHAGTMWQELDILKQTR